MLSLTAALKRVARRTTRRALHTGGPPPRCPISAALKGARVDPTPPEPINPLLIVTDLSGTVGDAGNTLVTKTYRQLMRNDPRITHELVGRDIGSDKRAQLLNLHHYLGWTTTPALLDRLLLRFNETYLSLLPELTPVAPGVARTFEHLRLRRIRIAYCTQFPAAVAHPFVKRLEAFGIHFDGGVTYDQVNRGRPHPDMIYTLMAKFGVTDLTRVLKIGDGKVDVEEAIQAGVIPAAVTETGMYRNATPLGSRLHVREMFRQYGARYVLDDVTGLCKLVGCQH